MLGCSSVDSRRYPYAPLSAAERVHTSAPTARVPSDKDGEPVAIRQAGATVPVVDEPSRKDAPLFDGVQQLEVDLLVARVLERNPSLAEMTAAWQAASARYPQVTSLEDPMFGATIGPATIGSNEVQFAYRLEFTQKLPYPGKLALRGQAALAEAAAANNDIDDMRLQLIEAAKSAYFDFYLVHRALAVNDESLQLLKDFRKTAEDRFRVNQAIQQDILQADVELGKQRERGLALERMRKVAIARLNTLMHLPPDAALPAPPKELPIGGSLPAAADLRRLAISRRPDLQARANRLTGDEAALGSAEKEFYPDYEVMAAYDKFMGNSMEQMAPMIGVRVNLPCRLDRRNGAVAEAAARIAQRRAELDRLTDQANFEVQQAFEQAQESERVVKLYEGEILPAARANVKAAESAYITGKIPFLSLIEAQRNVVMLQDRYYEAVAEYHRRLAALEHATGGPMPTPPAK